MPGRILLLTIGLCVAAQVAPVAASSSDPDVTTILRRTVERARAIAADGQAPSCEYRKISWYETLDPDGVVVRRSEKVYSVKLVGGMTENQLRALNGRELSPEESAERTQREREWRDRYATSPRQGAADRMDDIVNEDLFARFDFTLVGRERVNDRPCHVLKFVPRSANLPDRRLIDRVINLLAGTIWIDSEEFEISRAEVHTLDRLRLWGGVLGSVHHFAMRMERQRSTDGIWFNQRAHMDLQGRRLFSRMHVRVREIAYDVQPVLAAAD